MNILFGQSKIVHFIGIGGCGMSGLAELLLKKVSKFRALIQKKIFIHKD
jgi:UDP-N-acetylmuramate-alanine ligase